MLAFRVFSQPFKINHDDPETAIQYAWEAMACREAYDEAFSIFQELSYKGYHKAQYWLAHMFVLGEGRKEDFKQAKFWYEKAASRGNADAMRELGAMYACPEDYGYIVTKNTEKAKECEIIARNNPNSMLKLSKIRLYTKAICTFFPSTAANRSCASS